MSRRADLDRLYFLLDDLRRRLGGCRYLKDCTARDGWPQRGVYFFFEDGEVRRDGSPRVVRVGTHALRPRSRTTLWNGLSQHRGTVGSSMAGGGNHRGSILRLHVGTALLHGDGSFSDQVRGTWGRGGTAPRAAREAEYPLEIAVSEHVGRMPFLWLQVPDAPGPRSDRGRIESSTIALLSDRGKAPIDPPSPTWLGRRAESDAVRESGLWNVSHTGDDYQPAALDLLEAHVEAS